MDTLNPTIQVFWPEVESEENCGEVKAGSEEDAVSLYMQSNHQDGGFYPFDGTTVVKCRQTGVDMWFDFLVSIAEQLHVTPGVKP